MPLSNNDVIINHIYYWIPKDVKIQVSESKSSCRTSLTHITIYQILLVYLLVKLILNGVIIRTLGASSLPLPSPHRRLERSAAHCRRTRSLCTARSPAETFFESLRTEPEKIPAVEGEGGAVRAVRGAEEPYPPRFDVGLRSKSSVVDELSDGGGIYIYI